MKPYKFKIGSYWILKNDTTGILDSIVVTSTENDFVWDPHPVHGQPGNKNEFYKINLKSFTTSLTYNDYLTHYYIKRNGGAPMDKMDSQSSWRTVTLEQYSME
jgi:hypothetical protein